MKNNVEMAKAYLDAAYNNDIQKAKTFLSENIIMKMGGNNVLAGTYKGKEAFMEVFGRMLAMTNYTYKMKEAVEWLEGEKRALLIAVEQAEKDGEVHTFKRIIDYVIDKDVITEIRIFELQPEVVDVVFE